MTVIIVRAALLRAPVDGSEGEFWCGGGGGRGSGVRLPLAVLQDSHQNCGIELNVDHTHIFLFFRSSKFGSLIFIMWLLLKH